MPPSSVMRRKAAGARGGASAAARGSAVSCAGRRSESASPPPTLTTAWTNSRRVIAACSASDPSRMMLRLPRCCRWSLAGAAGSVQRYAVGGAHIGYLVGYSRPGSHAGEAAMRSSTAMVVWVLAPFGAAAPLLAAQSLPDGPARQTVQTLCTACHELRTVTDAGHTREDWRTVLHMMVNAGAPLPAAQFDNVLDYLPVP